jgi:hypothetical protein
MRCDMAEITRASLTADLLKANAAARRIPRHFVKQKEAVHSLIDQLLTQMEMLAEAEAAELQATTPPPPHAHALA